MSDPKHHLTVKERLYQIERTLQTLVREVRENRQRVYVKVERRTKHEQHP